MSIGYAESNSFRYAERLERWWVWPRGVEVREVGGQGEGGAKRARPVGITNVSFERPITCECVRSKGQGARGSASRDDGPWSFGGWV